MILQRETRIHRHDAIGEQAQSRLSLIECLRRMGFYDPEGLIGEGADSARGDEHIDPSDRDREAA